MEKVFNDEILKNKRGITLIALVITIIIILIIALATLREETGLLSLVSSNKTEVIEKDIEEYVLSEYSQLLSNTTISQSPGDLLSALKNKIEEDNVSKTGKAKFEVIGISEPDSTNYTITIRYQGVEKVVDLSKYNEGRLFFD